MPVKWLFVIAVFFLFSNTAQAAQFSGDYLLSMCGSDKDGKEIVKGGHAVCQSYIAGVIDYHNLVRSLGTAPSVDFCIPKEAKLGTLQKQVAGYLLRNKSAHGNFIASPAVALALFEKYPCGKS